MRLMPWSNHRPRARQYGREHQALREQHMRALQLAGSGVCAETRNPRSRCLHRSPIIYPTDALHLCHNSVTGEVLGLGHARCNLAEAARRANRIQHNRRRRTIQRQSALKW